MTARITFGVLRCLVVILLPINLFWTFRLYRFKWESAAVCNKELLMKASSIVSCSYQSLNIQKQDGGEILQEPIDTLNVYNISKLAFENLDFNIGRWDNQLLYKFKDFALIGDSYKESSESSNVCLATQTSVERLYSLAQVASTWRGPISVALFIAGNEEFVILQHFVSYMQLCFENIRKNVTFHIAVPRDYDKLPQAIIGTILKNSRFDCQYPEKTLRSLLKIRSVKTIQWRLRNVYPQNHMRNLARKGCQTKYVFLTDIDIIPSENIVPQLNTFLTFVHCNGRCAYVIPTFEVDVRAKFPRTKECMLRLLKKGLARPFHEKVFIYNQYATNFSKWISNTYNDPGVAISHNVTNFEFLYEPFYVAADNAPIHDERFMGYGFTRNSQVYEMYVAGYTFFVLTPVFTCHWGLQRKQTRPAWREQQNNRNRKKFEIFKSEIFGRYRNDPLFMMKTKLVKT